MATMTDSESSIQKRPPSKELVDDLSNAESPRSPQPSSFLALAGEWGQNIGMHGLPNITRSSSKVKKLLWTGLLIAGFTLTVIQIKAVVDKYYSHPINVVRDTQIDLPRNFPAVTMCNQSPARKSKLDVAIRWLSTASTSSSASSASSSDTEESNSSLEPDDETPESPPTNVRTRRSVSNSSSSSYSNLTSNMYNSSTHRNLSAMGQDRISDSTGMRYLFMDLYNLLNDSVKAGIGYQLEDLLVECSLGTGYCNSANFTRFLHPTYGNCYTFNAAATNATRVSVKQQGPQYGLTLMLYIDQVEYVGTLAQSAGMVVVVHEPTAQPFPEDSGIRVSPGMETYIGLKQTYTRRLSVPFSDNCAVNYIEANRDDNMYRDLPLWSLPNVNYTKTVCIKTCIQNRTESRCNCSSPKLPSTSLTRDPPLGACQYKFNSSARSISAAALCAQATEEAEFAACRSHCRSECDEYKYDASVSVAAWPSKNYEADALIQMVMYSPALRASMGNMTADERTVFAAENFVKLIVFYDDPAMRTEVSTEGYALTDVLSDMGGQVGLWLGLSVLTLFEVVEMLLDFVLLAVAKTTEQQQQQQRRRHVTTDDANGKKAAEAAASGNCMVMENPQMWFQAMGK